ncbi:MAG: CapA family protein [Candidatus Cloacimonetes bacterium]|nr:CapA family protein [Candidatus Cloacimonadota bacterium]
MNHQISIIAVGDIMLGELPISIGKGVATKIRQHGNKYIFQNIVRQFHGHDIVFGNLESVISSDYIVNQKSLPMLAHLDSVQSLSLVGFNVINLANNHIMQYGLKLVQDTIQMLHNVNIDTIGVDYRLLKYRNELIKKIKGMKIGFLGYNCRPKQYFIDAPIYSEGNLYKILEDVKNLENKVDFIIVSLHWGDEFIEYPSSKQIKFAKKLVDSGVNLILGHHPHIVQGILEYNKGIVVFSLGNFVFDALQKRLRETVIFKGNIEKSGNIDYSVIPVIINDNFQPEIMKGNKKKRFESSLEYRCNIISDIIKNDKTDHYYSKKLQKKTKRVRWENRYYRLKNIVIKNLK